MNFNKHSNLEGLHAFLSPSNYHWLNYDEEKLLRIHETSLAKQRGTELHEFAKRAIELGIKLPRTGATLNRFINDAIGFGMTPEQPLFYSFNCFGHADAIGFKDNLLRVHDLKTGMEKANMKQLYIYAALFCLEYNYNPHDIDIELRIYQYDDVDIQRPDQDDIATIMATIRAFDKCLQNANKEGVANV